MYLIIDRHTKQVVGKASTLIRACRRIDKLDNAYGGYRYGYKRVEESEKSSENKS